MIGGPELAGRGVIVHYPAHGARRLPSVHASAYVIADAGTGQVLAAKDPHGHFLPASTLKVLTADALMPVLKPDATVVTSAMAADVTPNKVGLVKGHAYRVSDLFQALLLISANDAAIALAQATGSYDKGVALMNAEAHRLQADDTVARRPNGLNAKGQHTSAYDLALFARQALTMPEFMQIEATRAGHVPAAPPPLDRVVQPEHHAQHLPWRPRRQDRLDHGVRDHVHRLGPAGRPHADRDPHALRPAHRDERRRQAAELGLRHGWEGHPGRHAGPAAARRSGRAAPRSGRAGAAGGPGPRSTAARVTAHGVTGPPAARSPAASRTSGWLRWPAPPPSR